MIPKWNISIFILFLLLRESVDMKPFAKFTNAKCASLNPNKVTVDQCRLRAINRDKTILNITVDFLLPVNNMKLDWQMKYRANGFKPWLGRYTIDFCRFLLKPNHPAIKMFYDIIKPFTNLNHTCPHVGKIYIKDLIWDVNSQTLPLPTGDYLLLLTWIVDNEPVLSTNVYFTFQQDLLGD